MEARQLVPFNSDDGRTSRARLCQAVNLPANGVLVMPGGEVITLSGPAAFKPACTPATQPAIIAGTGGTGAGVDDAAGVDGPQIVDLRDPFYASTFPQCYALAATTVIAYTLVIMLVITPRSFLDGGVVVLGRRGFTSGGSGSGTIGGRPWLQKVAALTVAISLTIATTNTFRVAEEQYATGSQNARELQEKILGGTELKIIRIISDTFLWLAQAQTLIRLFPRQREKVIIKWTAFALITLDLIFDSLNSFQYTGPGNTRPGSFKDAIPALSYVFQLALGVLYAAWVIYYSLMKKKYAYYHPQMKNICLVAALSLFAILVPVVFFILDISKPEFTGWGDYVRWVGAAAASVIVWEWVERIEALEREEKRDGILGREVFDGDEMLETPSDSTWSRRSWAEKAPPGGDYDSGDGSDDGGETGIRFRKRPADDTRYRHRPGASTARSRSKLCPSVSFIANRYRSRSKHGNNGAALGDGQGRSPTKPSRHAASFLQPPLWPSRPPPAATPISRTDTASADSTIYAIRYHPSADTSAGTASQSTPPSLHLPSERQPPHAPSSLRQDPSPSGARLPYQSSEPWTPQPPSFSRLRTPPLFDSQQQTIEASRPVLRAASTTNLRDAPEVADRSPLETSTPMLRPAETGIRGMAVGGENLLMARWRALSQGLPLRRAPRPSVELNRTPTANGSRSRSQPGMHHGSPANRWDLRTRMEDFAATQAERIREKMRPTLDTDSLPVTVIPAPPRRGAALARLLEEEESLQAEPPVHGSQPTLDSNPAMSPDSDSRAGPWRTNRVRSASSSTGAGTSQTNPSAPMQGATAGGVAPTPGQTPRAGNS